MEESSDCTINDDSVAAWSGMVSRQTSEHLRNRLLESARPPLQEVAKGIQEADRIVVVHNGPELVHDFAVSQSEETRTPHVLLQPASGFGFGLPPTPRREFSLDVQVARFHTPTVTALPYGWTVERRPLLKPLAGLVEAHPGVNDRARPPLPWVALPCWHTDGRTPGFSTFARPSEHWPELDSTTSQFGLTRAYRPNLRRRG